ncbi:retinol dehydrogenase [Aspergillus sclerotioniger CBS 115572]|uniref:Retinol dehydrogenase n=1 Tax=Aspergillus sclerotioniger CBS 115572 TaxID=1450535 RepID=A0A317V7Q0_9EURO|nr:retinol dehydrogenase [Aspergillus sclerotioniger CBS 115572]PWY68997.1 retinol dehydrogenase [Aspergillus sclerotioniger CBS 115572]
MDPYYKEHQDPYGPGDVRPTASHIIAVNGMHDKWQDKVVLITGATGAIGLETTIALLRTGAHIFITAHNENEGQDAVEKILNRCGPKARIDVLPLRMESLDSVKQAADEFLRRSPTLNVLINNAGIHEAPQALTMEGFESHFGINHLAHFTLITKLLPALKAGSSSAFQSRIIQVSDDAHDLMPVDFDDVNFAKKRYIPFLAYAQSKTAMIWTANYVNTVYGPAGVHALSVNPGKVLSGHYQFLGPEWSTSLTDGKGANMVKNPKQGAATTVWAAVGKVWEGKGGVYLSDCRLSRCPPCFIDGLEGFHMRWTHDRKNEERLWRLSLECIGMAEPLIEGMTPSSHCNIPNLGLPVAMEE